MTKATKHANIVLILGHTLHKSAADPHVTLVNLISELNIGDFEKFCSTIPLIPLLYWMKVSVQ